MSLMSAEGVLNEKTSQRTYFLLEKSARIAEVSGQRVPFTLLHILIQAI